MESPEVFEVVKWVAIIFTILFMTTDDSSKEDGSDGYNFGDGFMTIGMFINPLGGIVAYVFPSMVIPVLCFLLFYNFVIPIIAVSNKLITNYR